MLSMTSKISCVILVLASYCSSLPVRDSILNSTVEPFYREATTSGRTVVINEEKIDMMLLSNEETTSLPKVHFERSYGLDENSTAAYTESPEHVSHSPRFFDDTTEKSMTFESTSEVPSTYTRGGYEQSSSTMETRISFAPRELSQDDDENNQSTTTATADSTVDERWNEGKDLDMTTDTMMTTVESRTEDPSTSVDSFGKMTGLLSNDREETTGSMKISSRRPSTTTESSEEDDETMVHSQSKVVMPMKSTDVTKLTIIPGKVTETKVYLNAPKKSMMMMMSPSSNEHAEERSVQLDQGQN